ncbi:thioredoxin domain-containing protein [Sphingomonas sp. MMS24-JH45]
MILRSLFASPCWALSTAAPASSQKASWTAVAAPAPNGSYVVGDPKARVKLWSICRYTCPHCAHFAAKSDAGIKAMVRSGSISVEVRNEVHDGFDLVRRDTGALRRAGGLSGAAQRAARQAG